MRWWRKRQNHLSAYSQFIPDYSLNISMRVTSACGIATTGLQTRQHTVAMVCVTFPCWYWNYARRWGEKSRAEQGEREREQTLSPYNCWVRSMPEVPTDYTLLCACAAVCMQYWIDCWLVCMYLSVAAHPIEIRPRLQTTSHTCTAYTLHLIVRSVLFALQICRRLLSLVLCGPQSVCVKWILILHFLLSRLLQQDYVFYILIGSFSFNFLFFFSPAYWRPMVTG